MLIAGAVGAAAPDVAVPLAAVLLLAAGLLELGLLAPLLLDEPLLHADARPTVAAARRIPATCLVLMLASLHRPDLLRALEPVFEPGAVADLANRRPCPLTCAMVSLPYGGYGLLSRPIMRIAMFSCTYSINLETRQAISPVVVYGTVTINA